MRKEQEEIARLEEEIRKQAEIEEKKKLIEAEREKEKQKKIEERRKLLHPVTLQNYPPLKKTPNMPI